MPDLRPNRRLDPTRPDPSAIATLHRWQLLLPHQERLGRVARARLRSAEDAEDCVQETLLRAAMHRNLDEARVGAFLTATVVRLCVDFYRAAERQSRLKQRAVTLVRPPDPEETACDFDEGRWMMRQAQRRLRGNEQKVMLARANGISAADVPGELKISTKAAESAFTRARMKLRHVYEQAMDDGDRRMQPAQS